MVQLPDRIRKHENLHIVFWLVKDSCWLLEIRWLGTLMILPAMWMAVRITFITRKSYDYYLNLAVFFWISANSFWMVSEFFFGSRFKNLAGVPFALGLFCVIVFYLRITRARKEAAMRG